jgi:hypothetical protein
MKIRNIVHTLMVAAVVAVAWQVTGQENKGPNINEHFPVNEPGDLSPPIVSPVGECAKKVHVSGFMAHALIRVFVNTTTQVGLERPFFAEADISLTQPLNLGDRVTATQEVLGIQSAQSVDPVIVGPYPSSLNRPLVGPDLFSCGQVVPVDRLNPGTHVSVFRNGGSSPIGEDEATQAWVPVVTQSLNAGDQITAVQTACPEIPTKRITSPTSVPVSVRVSPNPPPAPNIEPYPVGADVVVLNGLFVGADVQVFDNGVPAGAGLATAARNRAPLQPAATSGSRVSASQKLCSISPPSIPQPPSFTLKAPTIVPPVCEGTHYVTVRDTYPNSIVVLFRNGVIAGMAGGILGDLTMALGGGLTFSLGDEIHVIQYVGSVISPASSSVFANCSPQNAVTQHNDNRRSGANLAETRLTPANVNPASFGRLYTRNVDGDTVGQPLYVHGVRIPKLGLKNLFFVTTSKNNIYAFDADNLDPNPTHGLVWQRNLCASLPTGVCGETWNHLVGITSTPVIDPNTNTIYVVARCSDPAGGTSDGAIFIYAINIADGTDRVPRVQIRAADPGNPHIVFDFHCQRNRPGLLLSKGIVYAAFGTFSCDQPCASAPYRGWVIGYRASDLSRLAVFDTAPNAGEAGIWQTGNGLVAADDGSIFFQTGNGPTSERLQDSFVKLKPTSSPGGLALAGSFTPNNAGTLSNGDTDLGSGGPMLLPNGRLIGGGKQGRYYVLSEASMLLTQNTALDALGFNGFQAFFNTYHNDNTKPSCPDAGGAAGCDPTFSGGTCFINQSRYGNGELCGPNIHGGPVFWQPDNSFGLIYEMPEKDFLKVFRYDLASSHVSETALFRATGSLARPPTDGMPGGFSSVSANGMRSGIIWTSMPFGDGQWNPVPGRLAAFDATTLRQLWSDGDDVLFAKSVPPTIADGKVFRATAADQVIVYGLINEPRPRPAPTPGLCYTIEEKYRNYGGQGGLLGASIDYEKPQGDKAEGRYQDYRRSIFGMSHTLVSHAQSDDAPLPTCSVPVGKSATVISSIYWSPKTCAHVVQGEIRELWLRLGGVQSKLGYPIEDETLTPDHLGRLSVFEHGEIWWYPKKGAYVRKQEQPYVKGRRIQRAQRRKNR